MLYTCRLINGGGVTLLNGRIKIQIVISKLMIIFKINIIFIVSSKITLRSNPGMSSNCILDDDVYII